MSSGPWKCPVCDGAGHTARPPWVPGDQPTWMSSGYETHPCRACDGSGIVWPPELLTNAVPLLTPTTGKDTEHG